MMQIYDISMPIHQEMPVYKNKPEKRPSFEVTSDFTTGSCRESRVHMDVHTGTHVDAPLHMVPEGGTIDEVELGRLIRSCRVLDLTHAKHAIHRTDLESANPQAGDFLLFKTTNSEDQVFNPEFVFLAEDGAQFLVDCGVAGVGIDALGIERGQTGHPTHKILFGSGVVIIEGLRLAEIVPGDYLLIATPLKLVGLDAAPARVVLCKGMGSMSGN